LAKPIKVVPENAVVRAGIENANTEDFPRLLRRGGERRGEEAASQSADERSPVHYSIT
jgi:hypothetical protein